MTVYLIAGTLIGFIAGVIASCTFVYFYARRTLIKKKDSVKRLVDELEVLIKASQANFGNNIGNDLGTKVNSEAALNSAIASLDRMDRVRDITQRQLQLQAAIEQPQRNSIDGRHKNALVGELKALEEEKNLILQSIIADGLDPIVSTMSETGAVESLPLSEFMVKSGIPMPSNKDESLPETKVSNEALKRVGKFTVHKGGKHDGGEGTPVN